MAWYKRTYNAVVNFVGGIKIGGVSVTASAAELNLIDGSVAGTAVASKALALGANKNVDVLAVADLKLGSGAGTSVTATAAELNLLDDSVAGTAVASRALALGANKNLDVLAVADLKLGAGAGTSVTATAAQINLLAQGREAGYKIARGGATCTGEQGVNTQLATVVAAVAVLAEDPSADATLVTVTIPEQTGGNEGVFTAKIWKPTAADNTAPTAATVAKNIHWIAIGT